MISLALPPLPEWADAVPALPPSPPTAVTFTALAASPVLPDWALDTDGAPELAEDTAVPEAWASPVLPESPLLPDVTARPTLTLPLIAVLLTEALADTLPVRPVSPESPVVATGLDTDVDDDGPVLPVLVADDWAVVAPESPEMASGLAMTVTDPPLPPLADATAIESPPLTFAVPTRAAPDGGALRTSKLMLPTRPANTAVRFLY